MSDTPSSPSPARDPSGSLLGKTASYRATYAPELLYPISRTPKREEIGLTAERIAAGRLPFMGADLWTAYELSWLTPRGKPQVAIATFTVPCDSPCIIESKSFKLYLNSFNMTRVESPEVLREMLVRDLSAAAGARVGVRLVLPEDFDAQPIHELSGVLLDRMDIDCGHYGPPSPELLTAAFDEQPVTETLTSHLLKSNCLVTGQPDWGSVQISYTGPQIDQEGLLRYLISFREHDEFHEQCVERIFTDLLERCQPVRLQVYARYTRRGGLDISPWRTSHPATLPANVRTARQ
ncbi:7-cyano-7-deazaguanine reductase [Sphaerotilus natans subsp. natans DSM 6575]|uniref:NADPH-dependent 7-cyano-7-deazaguanine reductase n=1 Tax=Sphaerotilus natans subsp. natans DSM 6575 TaxID=1286631 RepID=A0A059KL50_9BURK|nr:NADPH-dependent 7-cyano-7-deazaguanine reductase QueF [Sphaerotilus natans]KDB52065.1 7-cyano-7-deazaguanine reductase [Sphaerotilus natans subsp. natans DSM 6575]SIR13214.1 7-cyano-7-deazaguanine reductase [Sphaerotilus natans]